MAKYVIFECWLLSHYSKCVWNLIFCSGCVYFAPLALQGHWTVDFFHSNTLKHGRCSIWDTDPSTRGWPADPTRSDAGVFSTGWFISGLHCFNGRKYSNARKSRNPSGACGCKKQLSHDKDKLMLLINSDTIHFPYLPPGILPGWVLIGCHISASLVTSR